MLAAKYGAWGRLLDFLVEFWRCDGVNYVTKALGDSLAAHVRLRVAVAVPLKI